MKLLLLFTVVPVLLLAQADPAFEAYQEWEQAHRNDEYKVRAQSLLEVSAEWVKKWPDKRLAWDQRREALIQTRSHDAALWKEVDEKLIALSPPHTFASGVAYDWVTADVNLKDAESLLNTELDWENSRKKPAMPANPTLADLVDAASFGSRTFVLLCTLASANIKLGEFQEARTTIGKIHEWLDGDFKRNYDQDPLETFHVYQATYFLRSAELAAAEGRNLDALAFYQQVITNPYYPREYAGPVKKARALWTKTGGSDAVWKVFSAVTALPPGVPAGDQGAAFLPWIALDYKLPEMKLPSVDSKTWTNRDFEGKATMVYLWAASCAPCRPMVAAIQALYDRIKDRRDIQVVTLSADEDPAELRAFMKEKHYTFPAMNSPAYAKELLPRMILGQLWIVDQSGSIRLQSTPFGFGREQEFAAAAIYKLNRVFAQRPN